MKMTLSNGTHVYVVCRDGWLDKFLKRLFNLTPIIPIPVGSFGYSVPKRTDVRYMSKQYKKGRIKRLEDVQKFIARRAHSITV